MWVTAAAFAALVVLPLACNGIDFSEEPNFEITIHCGDTPVTLKDPGFSKVTNEDELQKLIDEKMEEALKSPACKELLENSKVSDGEEECPFPSDRSSTATPTTTTDNGEEPLPPPDDDKTGSTIYKIRLYENPNRFIGSIGGFPAIDTKAESESFIIISPGLQGTAGTVSFEHKSTDLKKKYLRHTPEDQRIRFSQSDGTEVYKNGSTFWRRNNKYFNGTFAYEAYDKPGYFIHCCGEKKRLQIAKESPGGDFNKSASFYEIPESMTMPQTTDIKPTPQKSDTATEPDSPDHTENCDFISRHNWYKCRGALIHPVQGCKNANVTIGRNPENNSTENEKWVRVDLERQRSVVDLRWRIIQGSQSCPPPGQVFDGETVREIPPQGLTLNDVNLLWLNVTSGCHYDIDKCSNP